MFELNFLIVSSSGISSSVHCKNVLRFISCSCRYYAMSTAEVNFDAWDFAIQDLVFGMIIGMLYSPLRPCFYSTRRVINSIY